MTNQEHFHEWVPELQQSPEGIQSFSTAFLNGLRSLQPVADLSIFSKNDSQEVHAGRGIEFHHFGDLAAWRRMSAFASGLVKAAFAHRPALNIVTHLYFAPVAYWLQQVLGGRSRGWWRLTRKRPLSANTRSSSRPAGSPRSQNQKLPEAKAGGAFHLLRYFCPALNRGRTTDNYVLVSAIVCSLTASSDSPRAGSEALKPSGKCSADFHKGSQPRFWHASAPSIGCRKTHIGTKALV